MLCLPDSNGLVFRLDSPTTLAPVEYTGMDKESLKKIVISDCKNAPRQVTDEGTLLKSVTELYKIITGTKEEEKVLDEPEPTQKRVKFDRDALFEVIDNELKRQGVCF